jgi:hypothetical protein
LLETIMSSPFEAAQTMANIWMDFANKMGTSGMAFSPEADPPEAGKQVRSAVFQSMTQYADAFLRSPQFLDMMKQSLDASIAFRKQMNDFLTSLHHNTQGVARQDVDSLQLSVRQAERRTLDRLETVAEHLDEIAKRLEKLESSAANRNGQNAEASHV